jgi:hypothetical protein
MVPNANRSPNGMKVFEVFINMVIFFPKNENIVIKYSLLILYFSFQKNFKPRKKISPKSYSYV